MSDTPSLPDAVDSSVRGREARLVANGASGNAIGDDAQDSGFGGSR